MRRGFTLLELLAVIVLFGVLAAVTMYRLDRVDKEAERTTMAAQNANRIHAAAERYRNDRGAYPADVGALIEAKYLTAPPYAPHAEGIFYIDPATGKVTYASGT